MKSARWRVRKVPRWDSEIRPEMYFVPQISALYFNLIATKLTTRMGHEKNVLSMAF